MKLFDLDPVWIIRDGRRAGFIFRSPANRAMWQSCFFEPTPHRVQRELFVGIVGQDAHRVQGCNPSCAWTCDPPAEKATFTDISVHPSLDGSRGGLWHGWIKNGEVRMA